MTSPWRISADSEPAAQEEASVEASRQLATDLKVVDGARLLLAQLNWDRFNASASPPGAAAPSVARDTLTRQAIRRKEARRRFYRSGLAGLRKAIA